MYSIGVGENAWDEIEKHTGTGTTTTQQKSSEFRFEFYSRNIFFSREMFSIRVFLLVSQISYRRLKTFALHTRLMRMASDS